MRELKLLGVLGNREWCYDMIETKRRVMKKTKEASLKRSVQTSFSGSQNGNEAVQKQVFSVGRGWS